MPWFSNVYETYSNIAIANIKGANYCCIISVISKSETINLMKNTTLTKKAKHHKT